MRIVSGRFGGRKLNVPKGRDIRPTSDKIRGAIFNMLASRDAIEGAYVLDAFCGTGALGLEAISRGVACCTFYDAAKASLSLAKENAEMLKTEDQCHFFLKNAVKIHKKPKNERGFDLIFLDPPYAKNLIEESLGALITSDWVTDGAWIVCESERSYAPIALEGCVIDSEKIYGETKVLFLRYHQ